MTSMDIFSVMLVVDPSERPYEIRRKWDHTRYAFLRQYVEEHHPDLFITCRAYARLQGKTLR
jgi:dTDP-4-dehydrorhamnose reductase